MHENRKLKALRHTQKQSVSLQCGEDVVRGKVPLCMDSKQQNTVLSTLCLKKCVYVLEILMFFTVIPNISILVSKQK